MAIKRGLGRLTLPHNILETVILDGFKMLPIIPEDGLGVADLPPLHADPFDRLLVIQAKRHDLSLITHDKQLEAYPVSIIKA